jgi:glycosyltransferase involved in cell wall biosynthesis
MDRFGAAANQRFARPKSNQLAGRRNKIFRVSTVASEPLFMKPLVSILIPAYNAQHWIADSLQSALAQTWQRKEIIIVDDGSTDRTVEIARRFATKDVKIISTPNKGLSSAVNLAFQHSRGDYIQELDSDDLLSPDKIEKQLGALRKGDSALVLLSSPWAHFHYRPRRARFIENSLWHDLSPVDWLIRKLSENLHMQNATWLVSRELAEAAGPWDETLQYDQDGEYFARVVLASTGTRFVPGGRVYYRISGSNRISYIGKSDKKKESLFRSMKLHIQYLRALEDSDRVRMASLIYLQNWYHNFYPDRPDIVVELQKLAGELGGALQPPRLRWKYAWMKPFLGQKTADTAQMLLPELRVLLERYWDKAMHQLETRG